jgi:hypothetical protein
MLILQQVFPKTSLKCLLHFHPPFRQVLAADSQAVAVAAAAAVAAEQAKVFTGV